MMNSALSVWAGEYGEYVIPKHLCSVVVSRNGWPDMRYKRAIELLKWIENRELVEAKKIKL